MKYTIKNNPQGTQEWLDDRKLHLTASQATAIATNGAGLKTLCFDLVWQNYCIQYEGYTSADMERGNELEGVARTQYMFTTGSVVEEVGFAELDEYVGVSSDGLVGKDGLVEIKCLKEKAYFSFLLYKKIKTAHIWQMQMQMYVLERDWCDYVVYSDNFEEDLIIVRVYRDERAIDAIKSGIISGKKLIKGYMKDYELALKENK